MPIFWIAFLFLVIAHEFGHAIIIRKFGFWVEEIVLQGIGGYCRWAGEATEMQETIISWGGILAQLVLMALAQIAIMIFGPPTNIYTFQIYHAFIGANLWMILFNLMPIEPLDGAKAWRILDVIRDYVNDKLKANKHKRQDKKIAKEMNRIMNIKVKPENIEETEKTNK